MELKTDCLFFLGNKPCQYHRSCQDCSFYKPVKTWILIIKLGARGDVLRTTPLATAFKKYYPDSHLTWLTHSSSKTMLENNPYIDQLLIWDLASILELQARQFDLLACFDKEPEVTALAMKIKASKKVGFGLNPFGKTVPLNEESEYLFLTGIDDELKFRKNQKSMPEMLFDACSLPYQREEYVLEIDPAFIDQAHQKLQSLGWDPNLPTLGLNTGSGSIFTQKSWTISGYIELIHRLSEKYKWNLLLMGGPEEEKRNKEILQKCPNLVIDTGTNNSLLLFCGLMDCCDFAISGDTLAMHIAIARKKPVLAIFGSTTANEIDLYDRGVKISSRLACAPCYKNQCQEDFTCMMNISVMEVLEAVEKVFYQQVSKNFSKK